MTAEELNEKRAPRGEDGRVPVTFRFLFPVVHLFLW